MKNLQLTSSTNKTSSSLINSWIIDSFSSTGISTLAIRLRDEILDSRAASWFNPSLLLLLLAFHRLLIMAVRVCKDDWLLYLISKLTVVALSSLRLLSLLLSLMTPPPVTAIRLASKGLETLACPSNSACIDSDQSSFRAEVKSIPKAQNRAATTIIAKDDDDDDDDDDGGFMVHFLRGCDCCVMHISVISILVADLLRCFDPCHASNIVWRTWRDFFAMAATAWVGGVGRNAPGVRLSKCYVS